MSEGVSDGKAEMDDVYDEIGRTNRLLEILISEVRHIRRWGKNSVGRDVPRFSLEEEES